nr:putative nucleotidyltransferase [uncultured Mediterranean phage uvMED]BAR27672.1 putative nucleotidyltransferase [uncultured Mediterranean phage uvMED]
MENEFGVRYSSPMKHVQKGWGYEKWIVNNEKYCGKLLYFNKGKKCSWHYHLKKEETFYIHSGKLHLIYGFEDDMTDADSVILNPGDKFEIPRELRHQMYAIEDTEMYEFSTTHFESDSYRVVKGD